MCCSTPTARVLNEKNGRALIDAGLDELRVSLDAANAEVLSRPFAARIISTASSRMCARSATLQEREGAAQAARVGVAHRPAGDRRAIAGFRARRRGTGVKEVYLQRLVFFDEDAIGMARPDQALFEQLSREEAAHLDRAAAIARVDSASRSARRAPPPSPA